MRDPSRDINMNGHADEMKKFDIQSSSAEMFSVALDENIDASLPLPNLENIKKERTTRTRQAMEAINPSLAHKLLPKEQCLTRQDKAAIAIQRIFRGYLARKEFVERLYEKYVQEEEEMEARQRMQVEEGEILIDTYHLQNELDDKATLRRNRARSANAHATTIQRAWKSFKRRQQGVVIPDDPIFIGRAEDGYNEDEFPYQPQTEAYHMRYSEHTTSRGIDINDIFDDSLENAERYSEDSCRSDSSDIARSFPGDYLIDDEFSGQFERMDLKFNRYNLPEDFEEREPIVSLPEPTTDWDTIESVLTNESGVHSPEDDENEPDTNLSKKLSSGPNLQLCFVDYDAEGTDTESDPEVKVYLVDDEQNMDYLDEGRQSTTAGELFDDREIDSRDSGCVPGDIVDLNIDYVTDYTPDQLRKGPAPAEESKKVLYSLQLHEEREVIEKENEEKKKRESIAPNSVYLKSIEELAFLRKELEDKVQLVSNELVETLMTRDNLHAAQESLLMEVEDLSKLAQGRQRLQASKNSTKVKI
eukprot:Seg699.6 transcript_id=Seg699.6/GoldUCD/mRNA.D3Y31 product="Schwannomin-interacting protein 1" protein_id=Seg699.6/GoldUCD/D3Y31